MWGKKKRRDAAGEAGKKFRQHRGHSSRKPGRGAEDSRVIEQFRNGVPQTPQERRKSPRYEAGANRVWLGWWQSEKHFVSTSARIVNISLGGAMLCPQSPPPQDRPCWLCLGVPDPVDYVEVAVLEVAATRQGQFAVRLAFREPCPYSFFKAVIDGHESPATLEPPTAPPLQPEEGSGTQPG